MPLTVDYLEKTSAAGRIPGGYFKREGRMTEVEVLDLASHRPPVAPAVPQGLALRHPGDRHGGVHRSRERLRRAGDDRRLHGVAPVRHPLGRPLRGRPRRPHRGQARRQPDLRRARAVRSRPARRRQPRRHRDGRGWRGRGRRGRHRRRPDVRAPGGAAAHRPSGEAAGRGRQAQAGVRAAGQGPGDRRQGGVARQPEDRGGDGHPRQARALRGARFGGCGDQGRPRGRVPGARRRGRGRIRVREEEAPARAGAEHRPPHRRARHRPTSAPSPARWACCRARTARRCSPAARPSRW